MGIFPDQLRLDQLNNNFLPELEQRLGLTFTAIGERSLVAECTVNSFFLQPHGIMHGGVSCVIGESLGSIAGNLVLRAKGENKAAVGQSLNALHLRPATPGTLLRAVAEPLHIGNKSQVWEILISDKLKEKAICKVSLSLAIIEKT